MNSHKYFGDVDRYRYMKKTYINKTYISKFFINYNYYNNVLLKRIQSKQLIEVLYNLHKGRLTYISLI